MARQRAVAKCLRRSGVPKWAFSRSRIGEMTQVRPEDQKSLKFSPPVAEMEKDRMCPPCFRFNPDFRRRCVVRVTLVCDLHHVGPEVEI